MNKIQSTKSLTCAETARLLRQVLKESFPGVKFSVKSSTYSGGASISIRWTDGPNDAQVRAAVGGFESAYFDGSIDYQGCIYHMMDGQPIQFGADYINTSREHSDAAIEAAIGALWRRYGAQMREQGIERPSVADFRSCRLWSVRLGGNFDDLQGMVDQILAKRSDRLCGDRSPLASRVFVTHDDGYSRAYGCGFSAVPENQKV